MPSIFTTPLSGKALFELLGVFLIVLGLGGYGQYQYYQLASEIKQNNIQTASTTADIETRLSNVESEVTYVAGKTGTLDALVQSQQDQSSSFQAQVGQISSMVTSINKLNETDPQLLQKYSKVYFLNENYIPASLSTIPSAETFEPTRTYQFLTQALPFLQKLLAANAAAGGKLEIASAYRSFGQQSALKSSYNMTFGAGTANSFSAEQGYSEHQLGTAVDFTTPAVGATFDGFDASPDYTWLQDNAYKYGFILSYPKGNTYYEYEPWHWRFVGVDLAMRLHSLGKNFYDLDQRQINDYLLVLFD